jgi:hypothetical protein
MTMASTVYAPESFMGEQRLRVSHTLVKVRALTAAEICANVYLPRDARRDLRPGMGPREFLDALVANQKFSAAIDFVAHALPAREAIWWGCLCFQYAFGDKLTGADGAACLAAALWVSQPDEEHRIAAQAPADAAGPQSSAGQLARAACLTGGSLAPPKLPVKPPSPFAPAKAVAVSVKLASLRGDKAKLAFRQKSFVELGIGVAEDRFL